MKTTSRRYFNVWLCLLLVSVITGTHIQFHKGDNKRSYLVFESNATSQCNNIPKKLLTQWHFVQTDTCMMVYNDFDCKSLTSGRFEPGTSFSRDFLIYSFHICNENEGGAQLNLDFTDYFTGTTKLPIVLESYKDLCKCVNIPRKVKELDYWSINNHGNEIMAYYEPNCLDNQGEATFILDGHSYESRNIYHLRKSLRKVQSVGPAQNSTYFYKSCLKMGTVTLPTVDLSDATEVTEKLMQGRSMGRYTSKKDIEVLIQTHAEEIQEIKDTNQKLQQKLENFKINIDSILEQHKKEFQQFTDKIKEDLQEAYTNEHPPQVKKQQGTTTERILTSTLGI